MTTAIGIGISSIFIKRPTDGDGEECVGPEDTIMDDTVKFIVDDNGDCLVDD